MEKTPIEKKMEELGMPDTRESFLALNYLGDVPQHIDPEVEETFPEKYRLKNAEENSSDANDEEAGNAGPESEGAKAGE